MTPEDHELFNVLFFGGGAAWLLFIAVGLFVFWLRGGFKPYRGL